MDEKTARTVRAEVLLEKLLALLGLIPRVHGFLLLNHLNVSMSKLTLAAIPALTLLNPIFAHLSFILGLVDFIVVLLASVGGLVVSFRLRLVSFELLLNGGCLGAVGVFAVLDSLGLDAVPLFLAAFAGFLDVLEGLGGALVEIVEG